MYTHRLGYCASVLRRFKDCYFVRPIITTHRTVSAAEYQSLGGGIAVTLVVYNFV